MQPSPSGKTYFAAAGKTNNLIVTSSGTDTVITRAAGDDDPITYVTAGCTMTVPGVAVSCPNAPVVDAGDGNDTVDASGWNLSFGASTFLGAGDDTYVGSVQSDSVDDDGGGSDTINTGAGNDYIRADDAGSGDVYDAGTGTDTINYQSRTAPVTVTLDGIVNDGEAGENDQLIGFENITGGQGQDTLTGDAGPNSIDGGDGDDTVNGGAGNDTLTGDGGNDTLNGDDGADTLTGGSEDDTLDGGEGADTLDGGAGSADKLSYASRTAPVTVTLDGPASSGQAGEHDQLLNLENVTGGAGNDTITGNASNNNLSGGSGDDTFDGGAGNDTFTGGADTDTVSYASRTAPVTADLDGAANDGEAGETDNATTTVENISGGASNDTLTGSASANKLSGGAGNDTLSGVDGNDTLTGGAGVDKLLGGNNDDLLLIGDDENDNSASLCGSGTDTVHRDATDPAPADCETSLLNAPGAPATTISGSPATANRLDGFTVTLTASETPSTSECKLDAGAWTACSGAFSVPAGLSDGAHTLQVRAADLSENVGAAATVDWIKDTVAPETTIGGPGTITTRTAMLDLGSSEQGSTFECSLDAGATWNACAQAYALHDLDEGDVVTLNSRATDAAGNQDATPAARTFTVDLPDSQDVAPVDPTRGKPDQSLPENPQGLVTVTKPKGNTIQVVKYNRASVPVICSHPYGCAAAKLPFVLKAGKLKLTGTIKAPALHTGQKASLKLALTTKQARAIKKSGAYSGKLQIRVGAQTTTLKLTLHAKTTHA